jgi:PAS domain-containing protein
VSEISIFDLFPELNGSVLELQLRRTLASGQPNSADVPSPFRENSILRFRCFMISTGVGMTIRDITEEFKRDRLADFKAALVRAIEVHGNIGYLRVSVRGTIDRAEETVCKMVNLPADRLVGVAFSDLIEVSQRRRFKEALENVLRGAGPLGLRSCLLSNNGTEVPVTVSIAQLQGAYGLEGAAMVLTSRNVDSSPVEEIIP